MTAPETVTVGGVEYSFSWWADGETEPSRTLDLGADTELSVIYQKVEAEEEPSEPEETGGGIPVPSGFLLVGILVAAVTLGFLHSRH